MIEIVKTIELNTPKVHFNTEKDTPEPSYEGERANRLEAVSIEHPIEHRLEGAKAPIYLATIALSEWEYLSIKRYFETFEEGFDEMLAHAEEYHLSGYDRDLTEEELEEMEKDHREGLCPMCQVLYDITEDWHISCERCPHVIRKKEWEEERAEAASESDATAQSVLNMTAMDRGAGKARLKSWHRPLFQSAGLIFALFVAINFYLNP